ncbi:acyl-CoA thioesterase [Natronorubrum daqingense]|uniref:Acyl-CoA thioester hydrolase n=1 Tax=Natronorubrum daqingense TaxID=588898 RepID=A0A1N6Z484_9EURY|nr:thioesterase family protein [Natronorubrum daqingense]APX95468.1 thioesterase [Natronorubrum daqingense]SIR21616.1 acyl-CoA thioester hydrolase [Natronorubrum daqingense]
MSEKFTTEVPVRFRDLDPHDHVNHAVYASYIEAARIDYIEEVLGVRQQEAAFVIANLEIDYKRPVTLDDEPIVELAVTDLGKSSCTMEYEILTEDGVAATAETTIVNTDAGTGRPEPLPDDIVTRISEFDGLTPPA